MSRYNKTSPVATFFIPSELTDDSLSSGYFSREDSLIRGVPFVGESSESHAEPADEDHVSKKRPTAALPLNPWTNTASTQTRIVPITRGRKREENKLSETTSSIERISWIERVNSAMTERIQQMGRKPNNLEVLLLAAAEIDKDDVDDAGTPKSFPARAGRKSKRKGPYSKQGHTYKCRKVFGLHQKDKWCNQCRWKKTCTMVPSS